MGSYPTVDHVGMELPQGITISNDENLLNWQLGATLQELTCILQSYMSGCYGFAMRYSPWPQIALQPPALRANERFRSGLVSLRHTVPAPELLLLLV
jgi:hypothetical protein